MEPETALLRISIVGTGKSIDFYTFILFLKNSCNLWNSTLVVVED